MSVRKQTNKFIEMVEEGLVDPITAVTMCVKYMSEDDVADMMDCNELSERFMEDDDYDDSMDGDHDSAMASAGMGTDEDYGYYGEEY
tara:strand:+ start:183 stop:443 length:261 start_codon:yes stop_codon:yes gene_type:complete